MYRLSGRAHVHSIGVLVQIIGTLAHIPHNIGVLAWIVWHTYRLTNMYSMLSTLAHYT